MVLLKSKDRRLQVSNDHLSTFPFNLIGYISYKPKFSNDKEDVPRFVTGSLISNCFVLSSGNNFLNRDWENGKIVQYSPISFTVQQDMHQGKQRSIKIKRIQVNNKFVDYARQIASLKKMYFQKQDSQQKRKLYQKIMNLQNQSIQYDFALLELQQKIERSQYFQFSPDLTSTQFKGTLVITGYNKLNCSYHLYTHSNCADSLSNYAIYYDIDTLGGQGGSPIYIQGTNKLVAIHKGHEPAKKLNYGILITESLVKVVEKWRAEINNSFKSTVMNEKTLLSSKNINKRQLPIISIEQAKNFPYNCIGLLCNKSNKDQNIIGTGFLIAQDFILTSASIIYQSMSSNNYQTNILTFQIQNIGKTIQIKEYKINPKFEWIERQIQTLKKQKKDTNSPIKQKKKKNQIEALLRQQPQFNYCLLKTSESIQLPNYFNLNQDEDLSSNPTLTIAGYQERSQLVSDCLKIIDTIDDSIYYGMNVIQCYPGSPIFQQKTHNLIGIHQGFSIEDYSSFGTMISSKAIEILEQWCFEMTPNSQCQTDLRQIQNYQHVNLRSQRNLSIYLIIKIMRIFDFEQLPYYYLQQQLAKCQITLL